MNQLDKTIKKIKEHPELVEFEEIMTVIDDYYSYTASSFSNGSGEDMVINHSGENEGSCKIFSFAKLHALDVEQTLNCFGNYYRSDVLQHPEKTDHANIRTFMKYGWEHIIYERDALKAKDD